MLDQSQSVPRFLIVRKSDGYTAWGVKIKTLKTGRNTGGIDPQSSANVTITHCDIDTGDDNVAIKSGPMSAAAHVTVSHNHFYHGHGMPIGSGTSGGVGAVRDTGLTIDGADNGIRIKTGRSRGGLVEDISYENVCMRNVANPIVLNTMYTRFPGNLPPIYRNIALRDVRSVTPGDVIVYGLGSEHKVAATFDNVTVDELKPANLILGNAAIAGNAIPGRGGSGTLACESRFSVFPAIAAPAAKVKVKVLPDDPTLYVAAPGTGNYYSVQRVIDVALATGATISAAPGTYREILTVTKPNIHLVSPYKDASKTAIVNNRSAGANGGTLRSSTVNVHAAGFSAENLTFANDFNATHPPTPMGLQALALLIDGARARLRNVRPPGNQDTLYVGSRGCGSARGEACQPARQCFSECYIEGNVDFIFGDGKAVFDRCEIATHRIPSATSRCRAGTTPARKAASFSTAAS